MTPPPVDGRGLGGVGQGGGGGGHGRLQGGLLTGHRGQAVTQPARLLLVPVQPGEER